MDSLNCLPKHSQYRESGNHFLSETKNGKRTVSQFFITGRARYLLAASAVKEEILPKGRRKKHWDTTWSEERLNCSHCIEQEERHYIPSTPRNMRLYPEQQLPELVDRDCATEIYEYRTAEPIPPEIVLLFLCCCSITIRDCVAVPAL